MASLWAGEPRCLRKPVLWYDAVSTAADTEAFDQHAALDALMDEVGLVEPADTTVKLQPSAKLQVSTDHAEVGESDNAKTGQTLSENKGHDPRSRSPPERAAALSHNRIPP